MPSGVALPRAVGGAGAHAMRIGPARDEPASEEGFSQCDRSTVLGSGGRDRSPVTGDRPLSALGYNRTVPCPQRDRRPDPRLRRAPRLGGDHILTRPLHDRRHAPESAPGACSRSLSKPTVLSIPGTSGWECGSALPEPLEVTLPESGSRPRPRGRPVTTHTVSPRPRRLRRASVRQRLRYRFDNSLARGPLALIG